MRRRQFLAGGAALLPAALAGCAHPPVVLDLEPATTEAVLDQVSMAPEPGSAEYRVVTTARDDGTATRRGRYDLFDRASTVRVDGAVYEVSETRGETGEVTVYQVKVDFDPPNGTADLGAIDYEDLPAEDRRRLDRLVTEADPPRSDGFDAGVSYGTAEEVGNGSVFVPDPRYDIVAYDGERYRVGVESRTATQATYRYTVTEVAADVETYADRVRERYRFTLADLSEAERAVVEAAIDGAYFEDDEAFRSVVDRLRDHEAVSLADFYGTWLLAYDGADYLAYAEW